MAYKKIQFKRGTKTGMPVLRSGEPGFTQDEKSLYIGDGTANQRFLNETQTNTRIDEKIAPVTQSITNNVATLNQTITNNVSTLNQSITNNVTTLNQSIASNIATVNQAITDKAKINGEATNVNLIRNEIVQRGLIDEIGELKDNVSLFINIKKGYNLRASIIQKIDTTLFKGFMLQVEENNYVRLIYGDGKKLSYLNKFNSNFIPSKQNNLIVFVKKEKYFYISVNGYILQNGILNDYVEHDFRIVPTAEIQKVAYYNRQLSSQEIQHNFSVLNNTKSINKINDYAISTDTHHIETPTGVTEEERYTELLKSTSKEFTSTGAAIAVNNGIPKQKVLSAKIEGQTVKNYMKPAVPSLASASVNSKFNIERSLNKIKLTALEDVTITSWGMIMLGTYVTKYLDPSTTYTLAIKLRSNSSMVSIPARLMTDGGEYASSEYFAVRNSEDIQYISVVTNSVLNTYKDKNVGYYLNLVNNTFLQGQYLEIEFYGLYKENVKVTNQLQFGLNSTQAVIENNGQKYTFYEPTIQGQTKVMKAPKGTQNWVEIDPTETRDTVTYDYKLESVGGDLGSVSSAYDYIDRARKVKVFNSKQVVLNGSENWVLESSQTLRLRLDDIITTIPANKDYYVVCDQYTSRNYSDAWDSGSFVSKDVVGRVVFRHHGITLISEWVSHLQSNPVKIRYRLASPIEVPMTDEEIKAYDAYRKVIDLGGAGDAINLLEVKEDGSASWYQYAKEIVCPSDQTMYSNILFDNTNTLALQLTVADRTIARTNIISSHLNPIYPYTNDEEGFSSYDTGNSIIIRINKSKLSTLDKSGVIKYLVDNKVRFIYKLVTPIVTTIPKELVPSILTDVKNEIKVDSAVAPTNLTVKLPVDRIAEIQAQLDQVTALITTPSNINLTMNYIEDEYNKNQSVEGVV